MKKLYVVSLLIILALISLTEAQVGEELGKLKAEDIEKIKIQIGEIDGSFILFQENIFKPNKQASGQIIQRWTRDTIEDNLKIIEEETMDLGDSTGASCTQKWYRNNKKEKIEIDIIVCPTESEIEKTVEIFTKKMYSLQFNKTDTPFAGEITWVSNNPNPKLDSYSFMFLRANVFVRIYINLNVENSHELPVIANSLVKNIESKLLSVL